MKIALLCIAALSCCCYMRKMAFCQERSTSSNAIVKLDKAKLTQAASLHSELVAAVTGGQMLESKLPTQTVNSYPAALTTKKIKTRGPEGTRTAPLNYKEAIARTEELMKDAGLRVTIAIESLPGKCNIKYRPVIGGAELDAGQTDLTTDLDPRWYIFSCDCATPPMEQRVDCTQDRKLRFRCK